MKREAKIILYDHDKEIGRRTFPFLVRKNSAKTERIISNAEDIVFGYPKIEEGEGGNVMKVVILFSCGIIWTPRSWPEPRYWGSADTITFLRGNLQLRVDTRINFNKLLKA